MAYFYVDMIVLGKVFSSCKLFVSGSVQEDLGDRTGVNSPERSCCFTHIVHCLTHAMLNIALLITFQV